MLAMSTRKKCNQSNKLDNSEFLPLKNPQSFLKNTRQHHSSHNIAASRWNTIPSSWRQIINFPSHPLAHSHSLQRTSQKNTRCNISRLEYITLLHRHSATNRATLQHWHLYRREEATTHLSHTGKPQKVHRKLGQLKWSRRRSAWGCGRFGVVIRQKIFLPLRSMFAYSSTYFGATKTER